MERLNKRIALSGDYSRNEADKLIKANKVKVNGTIINELGYKVLPNDIILVNDKPIVKKELTYFLMNKPTNYLSDPIDKLKRKNIKDLLLEEHKNLGLYPISKIDYSSGGIMVLTNDGILLNKHNQKNLNIEYGYELKISDIFKKEDFKKLRDGYRVGKIVIKANYIKISKVDYKTKTSYLDLLINDLTIPELKKLFLKLGYKVSSVIRYKYDFLNNLDLKRGTYRNLKIHEIKKLHRFLIK